MTAASQTTPAPSIVNAGAGFTPVDADVRNIIAGNLGETLFVEASAGTGKTSSLVRRVVNLIATGSATLDRIAAITFTEAAAAELRDRIRQELEKTAEDDTRSDGERERCRKGIGDLDQAAIRTLHAFAASLLHERPLEAGLPPGFETSDEIAAGIRFNEAWDGWLDIALSEDSPLASHLAIAITLGMSLSQLRETALEFHRNYVDLANVSFQALQDAEGAVPSTTAAGRLADEWPEIESLCRFSKLREDDRLYNHVQAKAGALRRLAEAEAGSPGAYRLLRRVLPLRYNRGRKTDWDIDPSTGDNACDAIKASLRELDNAVNEEIGEARRAALLPLLEGLRGFALDYAQRRRAEGRAEFHDLLVWARELLRDNLEVRDHFRRRFSHLLIDEAQDTDPIQTEIAMYLAESVPDGTPDEPRPTAWERITPEAGKLFVVGDPKQSIYRFRRADAVQMGELRQHMERCGGRTVSLTQNFRSQEGIIAWVNHLFAGWMQDNRNDNAGAGYAQAEYEAMTASRNGADGQSQPQVWALADEESGGAVSEIRRQEADDIAALLRQMVAQEWPTLDREADESPGHETYRPVGYSDVCILMPTRTGIRELERGLEGRNIPYRLESASLIFETQEVRDLLNCLRAIDDPANQVATVAALRSPAFGCSDVDLLRHHEGGGSFNCLEQPEGRREGPVAEGLSALRRYHEERGWSSTGALIDYFVRERGLMEAAVGHPRMREQWRRYRFLVEQARQFAAAGGSSLRAFVEWVEEQISERARVTEAPVPESDEEAVRVMTVHAAKGLEFPVVILTGINSPPRNRPGRVVFDRQAGSAEVGIGPSDGRFGTPGFEDLSNREQLMSEAEHIRLMYVAATRARDHLVVSLRRKADASGRNSAAGRISEYMAESPELWTPVQLQDLPDAMPTEPGGDYGAGDAAAAPVEHTVAARDRWVAERDALFRELGRPASAAATSLGRKRRDEEGDKEEQETEEPSRRGRAGTAIGRAVHAVLQAIDLASGDGVDARARAQAVAEGIPSREAEVARLSRVAVESDIVKRAVASGRLWREVPVAMPMGGGSLHGFIDLLFEESGGLVVVDYKTDSVSAADAPEAVQRYRLQGGAYAYAIGQLTGKPVKEVVFLYLQPRSEERLTDLPEAMRDAQAEAEALLSAAGA